MPLLELENVTKVFGDAPKRALPLVAEGLDRATIQERVDQTVGVADVTFTVDRGEIVVVMGLSGSGKSTLVRCINRLIEPTAGIVRFDGADVTRMTDAELLQLRRHEVGMVFQRFALFPHRSVIDNAAFGLEVMGVPDDRRRRKAGEVLELVGLAGWEDSYPAQLSGGMQQRVGLARALAVEPDLILMDEALSALDPLIRKDMQNEIIDLQRRLEKTIVFISHDLDEAINLGDRIVLMKDGRVVQEGTAEDILTNPASAYVERFVEDVDVARVLTAETVMKPVRQVVHEGDGPRTVLHKCREAGVSSLFVADSHGRLKGFARAESAKRLVEGGVGEPPLVEPDVRSVPLGTPLADIVPLMAASRDPIAVVDEQEKLRGVIVVGSLLAGLVEGRGTAAEEVTS